MFIQEIDTHQSADNNDKQDSFLHIVSMPNIKAQRFCGDAKRRSKIGRIESLGFLFFKFFITNNKKHNKC